MYKNNHDFYNYGYVLQEITSWILFLVIEEKVV